MPSLHTAWMECDGDPKHALGTSSITSSCSRAAPHAWEHYRHAPHRSHPLYWLCLE